MIKRIQPILALTDQGFAIYRRHFLPFFLLTACWAIPLGIVISLIITFFDEDNPWAFFGLLLLGALLFSILGVYLVSALSKATVIALEQRPVTISEALGIRPVQLVGMGCFSLIYMIVSQIVTSIISIVFICPLQFFLLLGIGSLAPLASNDAASTGIGIVFSVVIGIIYLASAMISGAVYSGLIYGLQPWIHEKRRFGELLSQSFSLLFYRFWSNLGAWCMAAVLFSAVVVVLALAVGVLVPLPLAWLIPGSSDLLEVAFAFVWLLGVLFALPTLPIWMTLLYRKNQALREGYILEAEMGNWWRDSFGQSLNEPQPNI
jgi:hypothetical protein